MRIGLISSGTVRDRMPPVYGGGIQKYTWNLGRELSKLGHEVHIFTRLQSNQLNEELFEGVYIHRIAGFSRVKIFTTFSFGFKTIIKIFKIQKSRGPFDILHAQSRVSGLIIRRAFRHKVVIFTAHNWDIAFTSPGELIPIMPYAVTLFIEKRIYSECDKIIALTKPFQQIITERYNIATDKISIIPNMVRVKDYSVNYPMQNPRLQKILKKKYLLFIGRLEREKGIKDLVENFKIITRENKDLKIVIIGVGTLEEDLRNLREQLDFREGIFILGSLHDSQLFSLLKSARALVLPSDYEIMPTVVLEAWAAECIVIVNRYYGANRFIQHKSTGLLFDKTEPNGLLSQVHESLSNEELRKSIIKNSKDIINSKYSSSLIARQILDIYFLFLRKR